MKDFKFKSRKAKVKRIPKPYPKPTDNINGGAESAEVKSNKEQPLSSEHQKTGSGSKLTIAHNSNYQSMEDVNTKPNKTPVKVNNRANTRINIYLLFFIFLYIIIEIVFNYILVSQMSYGTTTLDIQKLEFAGKIISGIGIALLLCKFLLNRSNLKFSSFLKWFVPLSTFGIVISFILQTYIVKYVVNNATTEGQKRALLVSAAATTLVPFFDDDTEINRITLAERILYPFYKAVNSDSNYSTIETKYKRIENFNLISKRCLSLSEKTYANHYPINSTLNKAFFSYSHLLATKPYEELHKKAIVNYYSCIFDDEVLVGMYSDSLKVLKDKVSEFYQEYLEKSEKYNINLKKYPNRKKTIDERWQRGVEDTIGSESNLTPNLPYEAFVKHPDVKTYIKDNQAIKLPYPYADDMSSELKSSLPDFILANYLLAKREGILEEANEPESDVESGENQEQSWFNKMKKLFVQPTLTVAQSSYKAVMMPIIALGFSVTFLVLNVISMFSLILSVKSRKISIWFQRLVTALFFILPFIVPPSISLSIPANDSMLLTILIKFLYFYQQLVWSIQQAFIGLFI